MQRSMMERVWGWFAKAPLLPTSTGRSDEQYDSSWLSFLALVTFCLDVILHVVVVADLLATRNAAWAVGAALIILMQYFATWLSVVLHLSQGAEKAPRLFGFDDQYREFYLFGSVFPWRSPPAEGHHGQFLLGTMVLAGPFGIVILDLILVIKTLNSGDLPFSWEGYRDLQDFYLWYDAVRANHEAVYEALPLAILLGTFFSTQWLLSSAAPVDQYFLILSTALSCYIVYDRLLVVMWHAKVSLSTFSSKLVESDLPLYGIVHNGIKVLERDSMPEGLYMDVLCRVLEKNRSVHTARFPGMPSVNLDGKQSKLELREADLTPNMAKIIR